MVIVAGRPRIEFLGALYHIIGRGSHGQKLLPGPVGLRHR